MNLDAASLPGFGAALRAHLQRVWLHWKVFVQVEGDHVAQRQALLPAHT